MKSHHSLLMAAIFIGVTALGAGPSPAQISAFEVAPEAPEQGGIRLPTGFVATVFHDGVGRARHVAVRDNGDVYVRLGQSNRGGGIAVLRDEDGDGTADRIEYFGGNVGTGMAIHNSALYASSDTAIYRWPLTEDDALVPNEPSETIVEGFPEQNSHAPKAFSIDSSGNLYVNVGAPSNACQKQAFTTGSPGMNPCPQLVNHAGIWRFDADKTGQTFADGARFLTCTRNIVALDWNPLAGRLYFVMHGRDQLHQLFPDLYTVKDSAELPGEEFHRAKKDADYGWPYTYWDWQVGRRMVAPEFGGDGKTRSERGYEAPLLAFPGHWGPNDILFYTAKNGFPSTARGGAFIAFHGSGDRAPLPQAGYQVVFVPFDDAKPADQWVIFADGFKGAPLLEHIRFRRNILH